MAAGGKVARRRPRGVGCFRLFGLQESGDCLHFVGLEVFDDTVHDWRFAQVRLNDGELSQNVFSMLTRQPRKDAVARGIGTVACGASSNAPIGEALLE